MALGHDSDRPLSALPPRAARLIAFISVLFGGLLGGLLGYSLTSALCDDECTVEAGVGLLLGSIIVASGMAIVAVISLRAMGEWRDIKDRERAGHAL